MSRKEPPASPPDDERFMLSELERLAGKIGVAVRYEVFGEDDEIAQVRSGLCRLNDDRILLVDRRLPVAMRCRVLAEELKRFDLSAHFVPPRVRLLLDEPDDWED